MPDASFLLELHDCEQAFDGLARARQELPGVVDEFDSKAQAARDVVAQIAGELAAAESNRRSKEAELQDCETQRDRFQGQTVQVKTNTEYTALLHELEQVGAKISDVEEEILLAMETIDDCQVRLESTASEQKQIEAGFERQAAEARDRLTQVESELGDATSKLGKLTETLDAKTKNHFERTRKAKGSGTTRVADFACGSCHRAVPLEDINRVAGGEILTCGNCARLLVVRDEY